MRTICLDVGERRIGVAVSDPLDFTAQGVETIFTKGAQRDAARVRELCAQYETTHILCGLPLNMDGSEGFQAQRVKALAALLTEMGFEVRYQDERLTTRLATGVLLEADVRRSKRKEVVDKLAATYILQSFLDAGGWKDVPAGNGHKKVFQSEVWHMREQDFNEQDMELDPENIVELVDDEGNEVRFEHLMTLEHKGNVYICLAPAEPMEDVAEVIDNGDSLLTTLLRRTSPEFNRAFYGADVVIAKGMGNYEGLYGCDRGDIWFLMIAKCNVIARLTGTPRGSILCMRKA